MVHALVSRKELRLAWGKEKKGGTAGDFKEEWKDRVPRITTFKQHKPVNRGT